jgi:predicted ATPase
MIESQDLALVTHQSRTAIIPYLEPVLTVARKQQAKSWELRAAMSLARLWHDQARFRRRSKRGEVGARPAHSITSD